MLSILLAWTAARCLADTISLPPKRAAVFADLAPKNGRSACVSGGGCNVFALTPSLPVTFSKLDFNPDGSKTIGSDIAVGGAATFMLARGTYTVNSSSGEQEFTVESATPYLFFGVAGQTGMTETPTADLAYSLTASGFVGTRFLALMGGYDFINDTPFVGVAANVTGTSIVSRSAVVFDAWR